jgi:hypothetical protein
VEVRQRHRPLTGPHGTVSIAINQLFNLDLTSVRLTLRCAALKIGGNPALLLESLMFLSAQVNIAAMKNRRNENYIVAAIAIILQLASPAAATETEIAEASLDALLQNDIALSAANGPFRFSDFQFDPPPSGSAIPDLMQIVLSVADELLLWQIGEDRRILRAAEQYEFGVKFRVTALDPGHVLTSAMLDIAGATIGTKGDANAQLTMDVLDIGGNPLGSLSAIESSTHRDLVSTQALNGSSEWLARLRINASGGSGTAALVLTDIQTSFVTAEIPEPSAIVCGCCGVLLGMLGRRRVRSRLLVRTS